MKKPRNLAGRDRIAPAAFEISPREGGMSLDWSSLLADALILVTLGGAAYMLLATWEVRRFVRLPYGRFAARPA